METPEVYALAHEYWWMGLSSRSVVPEVITAPGSPVG